MQYLQDIFSKEPYPDGLNIITRAQWNANEPTELIENMTLPIKRIIVHIQQIKRNLAGLQTNAKLVLKALRNQIHI